MFVCVARLSLQIPESGSLKAKRQVLRRVTDRVKARFNVAVAEVEDNDVWQKATLALSVVGNDRRHVNEQMDKIIHFVEEMYVAPVTHREMEILAFGDQLFSGRTPVEGGTPEDLQLRIQQGERSLAEAEGLGEWEERHEKQGPEPRSADVVAARGSGKQLPLDEARARARALRNPRDWEKK